MRVLHENDLVAGRSRDGDGDRIRHRSRRHEEGGFLPQEVGRLGLESLNRRVVLQDIVSAQEPLAVTPELIMERVSRTYQLTLADLTGPSRKQPLALSRQIAMYMCRELTDLSLPRIGDVFGGRDHTTVMHAVEKVKRLMQSDKRVFDEVTNLCQDLRRT